MMNILLEELPHQEQALAAILASFTGIDHAQADHNHYANPLIKGRYDDKANIDIKMETGTGKTYVYTRLMYELHQNYGLFKFVLVVPTPAIKEGARNFITSDYARQHFSQFYENTRMELCTINAGDFKVKSGRKNFPAQLLSFTDASRRDSHTIQVLLINAQMLNSASMTRDDYDQTLLGGLTSPVKGLQMTRPVVIIDEPHRFARDNKFYRAIQAIQPQMIVRFGATFPDIVEGKGKNKCVRKDYYRRKPQFDLNAVDSFNDGLVKGIDIYYPNLPEEQANNRYIVDSVTAKKLILRRGSKIAEVGVGENLADVDAGFEGSIEYAGSKMLSNDLELEAGMALVPGTFGASYQELIIQDAIDKHFDTEQANFLRSNEPENNAPRIKTLSLFFIDSIKSYRDDEGWLKVTFERLLKKKLTQLIDDYQRKTLPREVEYLSFLQATLASLHSDNQNVHAGYFGEDRGSGDEAIQAEVDDILKNKEKLLSFSDHHGNWETRRFLFSKWTLREGWDNPNVFVIAKLRSSGSESSKIQEVGRGLRLPVDENGHRVHQEEWPSRLSFLIGYDEKAFANMLVDEINRDSKVQLNEQKLDEAMITLIVTERQKVDPAFTELRLLEDLDDKKLINRSNEFKPSVTLNGETKSGFAWLLEFYPELTQARVRADRIRDNKPASRLRVRLRKENWEQLSSIWEQFSRRYMLQFERSGASLEQIAAEVLRDPALYIRQKPSQVQQRLVSNEDNGRFEVAQREGELAASEFMAGMKYGHFLKQLALRTSLPVNVLHPVLMAMLRDVLHGDSRYLSEISLDNMTRALQARINAHFAQRHDYLPLDFQASTSVFDSTARQFREEISAEIVGKNVDENAIDDPRSLYQIPPLRYDSVDPELSLLKYDYPQQVSVFGKLPKRAIQIPKYTGGSTTPDFVYRIERQDADSVYLLVETKAENMRVGDQVILDAQRKFFDMLRRQNINVEFAEATSAPAVFSTINGLIEGKVN
ncbi:type III restriction-modification system endonuclease [Salmonella enterica]|nr:type III restriction-modification system endonuclease [Salmonella enterica]ECJ4224069.1 type III restriction-modification system endonuclease [Salmonella enterica subsp. enterica]EBP7622398.1 type III restriction-modification system endonuclease [Salmonella enterica]EBP9772481.1 type III restriction-modification system endonuclease [Salmonella enterica]EDI7677384.1 type III restriction endonuclease subunit R [Salmonella enterica]